MKAILLATLTLAITSVGYAKTTPPTHESMTELMLETRDIYYSGSERQKYLAITHAFMKKKLAAQLKVTTTDLGPYLMANQTAMDSLESTPWLDLQTEFYTTLHQELLNQKWITKTQNKKISDYGKNLADGMILHLAKYSAPSEGRYYNRYEKISQKRNGVNANSKLPHFVMFPETKTLLTVTPDIAYRDFMPSEQNGSRGNPSAKTLKKTLSRLSNEDFQERAEMVQLNHKIYLRAVANNAKTIASVNYLTGAHSWGETESKVRNFLNEFCEGCSDKEKKDYLASALIYVKAKRKNFKTAYTPQTIVTTFCSDLKKNGYAFQEPPKAPQKPGEEWMKLPADNTRVDQTRIMAMVFSRQTTAISKTIKEHDLGVLFFTDSLTKRSEYGRAYDLKLNCRKDTVSEDIVFIKNAINEAKNNTEKYISDVNDKINYSGFSEDQVSSTLEHFAQTNIASTAEALMTFPQGMDYVVDSLIKIDRDVKRRKRIDSVVAWGGTIIGVGLTVTGIGAPEGVAILLAVAAMTKGAVTGTYFLYRSQQEKSFAQELQLAMNASGGNFYAGNNLSLHYSNYRKFKTQYISDFASSAMSFGKIHSLALANSKGDVVKAHSLIQKSFTQARSVGTYVTHDEMLKIVVDHSAN